MSLKKAEQAPGSGTPGPGHNENGGLTDDQRQALFFQHLGKVRRQKEKVATTVSELRALYKAAKADKIPKKDIDFALGLEGDSEDEEERLAERRRHDEIARWMQHPLGMQADMFGGTDRTPAVDRAFEQGKVAGMEGKSKQTPYDVSTPQGQRWLEGWDDGQKAIFNIQKTRDAASFDDGKKPEEAAA